MFRLPFLGLGATVVALAVAPPAAAQRPVPRDPVILSFGACAARQSPVLARALMATEIESREEYQRARQLFQANDGCLSGRLVLSSNVGEVRGTVAEALLEREPATLAQLSRASARPAVRAQAAEGRRFVTSYARCLADAEPAKAARLLATDPRSPAERDALMSFGDTLNDCMPMGFAYGINRFEVRNHLAVRLYEVAMTAQPEEAR